MPFIDHYRGARKQDLTTPRDFFVKLHERFCFTMDGAATTENRLLTRASTLKRLRPWSGERVFCNPPWSDIPPFLEKAPTAELVVFLVPARVNARWFHRALELGARVEFFKPKLRFGGLKHNSPTDCLLLIFGA